MLLGLAAALLAGLAAALASALPATSFALGLFGALASAFAFRLFLFVEAVDGILAQDVAKGLALGLLCLAFGVELLGLDAVLVEGYHLKGAVGLDGHQVGWCRLVGRVGDLALKQVGLKLVVGVVLGFQPGVFGWHFPGGLDIAVDLKVDAALELGALASQLLGVERDVLVACCTGSDRHKVGHPAGTAQRAPAGPDTAYAASLLACPYLLHLDAYLEHVGQHLDELAKVDALVGDIVEYGLVAVALVLDIAYLHL